MLPVPVVPACPVMVKDRVVVLAVWFTCIWALLIWLALMFPSIARFTVAPEEVVASMMLGLAVGAAVGVGVMVGVGFLVGVGR